MRRVTTQSVCVCSLTLFFLLPLADASDEQPENEPRAAVPIDVPDGSLEELSSFLEKHDKELNRLFQAGQLGPDLATLGDAVLAGCAKILADPEISDVLRRWTLRRRANAQVILAYVDPAKHYGKLVASLDEYEEQLEDEKYVQTIETYILRIGIRIVTAPNNLNDPKPLKLNFDKFVDRLLFYLETYPEPESTEIVRRLLDSIKVMPPIQRDKMMLVTAERLVPHYLKSKDAGERKLGRELEATARLLALPGKPMLLEGVLPTGEVFDPQTLKGKVVLVQFWEPACIHCRTEMPLFADFLEQYGKKGFEVVGVCIQGNAKVVQDYMKRPLPEGKRITWPILVDELAPRAELLRLAEFYNIKETPVLALIGRDGNVVRVNPLPSALALEIERALYPTAAVGNDDH